MTSKKRILLVSVFLGVWVMAVGLEMFYGPIKSKKNWDVFNSSAIHGIIVEKSGSKSGTGFSVSSRPEYFIFWPKLYGPGDVRDFILFVRVGDSVSKERYSDTLYMYRDHQRYPYTFSHP